MFANFGHKLNSLLTFLVVDDATSYETALAQLEWYKVETFQDNTLSLRVISGMPYVRLGHAHKSYAKTWTDTEHWE